MNCVAYGDFPEIIDHVTVCRAYKNESVLEWHEINKEDIDEIMRVGLGIEKRIKESKTILKKDEVGRACVTNSRRL